MLSIFPIALLVVRWLLLMPRQVSSDFHRTSTSHLTTYTRNIFRSVAFVVGHPQRTRKADHNCYQDGSSYKTKSSRSWGRTTLAYSSFDSTIGDTQHEKVLLPHQKLIQEDTFSSRGYRTLYEPTRAYRNGTIQVDSIHTLYYEEYGQFWHRQQHDDEDGNNDNDKHVAATTCGMENSSLSSLLNGGSTTATSSSEPPILHALFLHGGPGAGCSPRHAQFFDPSRYHIVLLDQRGSGRSRPRGEVRNFTLREVVQDCETLRLQVLGSHQSWHVVLGGSWGSTVALAYVQQHPEVIKSVVLRGICLLRPSEVDYLFADNGGAALRHPQAWREFSQAVQSLSNNNNNKDSSIRPANLPYFLDRVDETTTSIQQQQQHDRRETLHAYYDRLLGVDPIQRWNAARSWAMWEHSVASSNSNCRHDGSRLPIALVATATDHSAGDSSSALGTSMWSYQDAFGQPIDPSHFDELQLDPADRIAEKLRKGLSNYDHDNASPLSLSLTPRIVRPLQPGETVIQNSSLPANDAIDNWIPSQAMLTCFFSVNERYACNNVPLLHPIRMGQLRQKQGHHTVKVIAIHGGQDCICPVDNALDLHHVWPEIELRIPLDAGHSMYDPAITNEIIQATDRLANISCY